MTLSLADPRETIKRLCNDSAIFAFVDRVQNLLNSNPALLCIDCPKDFSAEHLDHYIESVVRSEAFCEQMFAMDQVFERYAYHWLDMDRYDATGEIAYVRRDHEGSWVRRDAVFDLRPMSLEQTRERLIWMLCDARHPYEGNKPNPQYFRHERPEAAGIVDAFSESIFRFAGSHFGTSISAMVDNPSSKERIELQKTWHFFDLAPKFLHNAGYYTVPEPEHTHPLAFFEDGDEDTATIFTNGKVIYFLLTNGSP